MRGITGGFPLSTRNPKPKPKPQTPNPKPQTPNPKPQTPNPNPNPQTLNEYSEGLLGNALVKEESSRKSTLGVI